MSMAVLDIFQAALKYYLAKEGYGAQAQLAKEQNIDPGYLDAIITGQKGGSNTVRTKIAYHFETNLEKMLTLGRRILSDEEDVILTAVLKMDLANFENQQTEGEKPKAIIFDLMKAAYIFKSNTHFATVFTNLTESLYRMTLLKEENLHLHAAKDELKSIIRDLEERLAKHQPES
jgi:hypothetical protein